MKIINLKKKITNLTTIILAIILVLLISSCKFPYDGPQDDFKQDLENASVDFRDGWRHGCEVGSTGGTKSFYGRKLNNNKVDGYRMSSSTDYKTAWNYAFWYCYRSNYVSNKGTLYSSFFGGLR